MAMSHSSEDLCDVRVQGAVLLCPVLSHHTMSELAFELLGAVKTTVGQILIHPA